MAKDPDFLETWDVSALSEQEHTFGRYKASGAPLTGKNEDDPPDLTAVGPNGALIIPADAHIRVASPSYNGGRRLLRRGYSFCNVADANSGGIQSGLLFICFQRNPVDQFVRLQRRLAATDHLNRYTQQVGSALFAIPPGAASGGYVGGGLLG